MDWGSLPDWLAAIGTLLAVAVSVSIAVYEVRKRREGERLLAAEHLRARQSDAAAVVAWVESKNKRRRPHTTLRLLNSGTRPVFAVAMIPVVYGSFERGQPWAVPVVGPGVSFDSPFDDALKSLVTLHGAPENILDAPDGRVGVKLIFRDSEGRSWERGIDGKLKEREWNFADDNFPPEPGYVENSEAS
jgi:hypothetical protein